jgi:hypothetical protein
MEAVTDPLDAARRVVNDVQFWRQVIGDSKRVIYAQPDSVDAIRAAVDALDAGHLLEVRSNPYCPDGQLLIVDEQAVEASFRESMQHWRPGLF